MKIRNAADKDNNRFSQKTIRMASCLIVSKNPQTLGSLNTIYKTSNKEGLAEMKRERIHLRKGRSY